jgi:hypothetical protein
VTEISADTLSRRAETLLDEFKRSRERAATHGGSVVWWLETSMRMQELRCYCKALAWTLGVPAAKARTKSELAKWAVDRLSREP